MVTIARTTLHGDRCALIARQRPAGGLDQISLGLDLPPDLVLRLDGEMVISVAVHLGSDGRPVVQRADIQVGDERWTSPARA